MTLRKICSIADHVTANGVVFPQFTPVETPNVKADANVVIVIARRTIKDNYVIRSQHFEPRKVG